MEVSSNLVWLAVCGVILTATVRGIRHNRLGVSSAVALTTAFALCLVLLPVISMSDDLLQARQDVLPLAAQTWHLASEGASAGLEIVPLLSSCLLAMLFLCMVTTVAVAPARQIRRHSAWLTRSQRLRPPPPLPL